MGFQLKLLSFWVFLLLTLSFSNGKNSTVEKVIGLVHCTACIRNEFRSNRASSGINVLIRCKSWNRETKTHGNGTVDRDGKFSVTLSAVIPKNGSSIAGCFAELQSASASPCPLKSAQTASLKLFNTEENATQVTRNNRPILVKFSPLTCQSTIFWPLPGFTFFPTWPYPPALPALPPLAPLVQPPLPSPKHVILPSSSSPLPSYLIPTIPLLPPTYAPAPAPEFGNPSPYFNQLPPPSAPFYRTPTVHSPIPAPPSPIGISNPPNYRNPNPIPRAPPVPLLPPIPTVPRQYFNPPKSISEPPHSSDRSHS